MKEKKQLFFATVDNENGYSKDEIKAIGKKIERIGKEANELEVKLIDIENQAEHGQIVVAKLKEIMNNAESDYGRIKSAAENDLEDLKLKTMKKFDSAANEKVKMVKKKKKKSSFFSRFRLHKKKKSEGSAKQSHHAEKKKSSSVKSSKTERLIEKRAKAMKKERKWSSKKKTADTDSQFLFTLKTNGLLIDDFNSAGFKNILGNRANTYQMAPSTTLVDFQTDTISGVKSGVLRIEFDKKNNGVGYS